MWIAIGIVVGGGNFWRGSEASEAGIDRVTADNRFRLFTTPGEIPPQVKHLLTQKTASRAFFNACFRWRILRANDSLKAHLFAIHGERFAVYIIIF